LSAGAKRRKLAAMRRRKWLLIAVVALGVGGCASTPRLTAEVESFSTLADSPAPAEVAIVPFTGVDGDSLEFERYRERLGAALAARGFEVVPVAADPPWRLRLGYRVGDGRQVVDTFGPPPYHRYRPSGRRTARGYDPFFDDPFFFGGYDVVTYTVYGRHLVLVLVDAASGAEVWRASAFNVGRRRSLRGAFDGLVAAALADFPAEVSGRVTVTLAPEA